MAKRMTDTDKWKKKFVRGLQGAYKLLWFYICDDCDHAGIWHVDIEVAQIRTGEKVELQKALEYFKDKIYPFDNGEKWFLPDYIDFQYGTLKETNNVHLSVIKQLKKYNLIDSKGCLRGLQDPKEKEEDKAQDKDTGKEEDKDNTPKTDFILCRDKWFEVYEENKNTKPTFNKVDGATLKQIITKINSKVKEEKMEGDLLEHLVTGFEAVLRQALKEKWLSDHYNLRNINSQFDIIYANGKQLATKKQSVRDAFTERFAE